MATSTTPTTRVAPSPPPRRTRGLLRLTVLTVVGAVLVVAGILVGLRAARAGVLPGVLVEGVPIGGESQEALRASLTRLADQRAAADIRAVRGDAEHAGTAGDLGYVLDVDATMARAMYRGRQGNPVDALRDHLRAFTETTPIEAVERVEPRPLARWAQAAAQELVLPPREGGLRFEDASVRPVYPRAGGTVLTKALREDAEEVLLTGDGGEVPVQTEAVSPRTTRDDVDAALARGRRAVSAPVTFRRSGAEVTLSPAQIGGVLRSRLRKRDGDVAVVIVARPDAVTEAFGAAAIDRFERDPKSARVVLRDGGPHIIGGHPGFAYDAAKAARQVVRVATGDGDRTVELAGDVRKPELTTAEARDLEITEEVSQFTTEHACCESRVTNIHRIADIIDGVVIRPGETFSVNDFVGERTTAKGFVRGGAIFDGEFVEQVGGGVSQFATTLFNAAWFGGYSIPVSKTHSYYISRYPEGREATLNYPNVDLQVTNDSPYGMLLDTSYTDTSITVKVWGDQWVEVSSETGPRTNLTNGETQYRENNSLPRGAERVVQQAGQGFDVTVTRTLLFPDGRRERQEKHTRYLAQPRIVERNTGG